MAFLNGTDPSLRQTRTPTTQEFTASGQTAVTLSDTPPTEDSVVVTFDGITQHRSTYSISGTTLTFDAAVPTGVSKIEVTYTTSHGVSSPADSSVTSAKIADGAVTTAKLASGLGFLTRDEHGKAVRAMMLEIADTKGAAIGFPEGNADPFDTDTITATSTNAEYDAANDYYKPSPNLTLLNTEAKAPKASAYTMQLSGPWGGDYNGYIPRLIDGDTDSSWHSWAEGTSDIWQVYFSGGGETATACKVGSNASYAGAHNSGSAPYSSIVLKGSTDGASWTTLYTVPSGDLLTTADTMYTYSFTNTTAYQWYKIDWSWSNSYYHKGPTEFAWYEGDGTSTNGTFVSPAYTATATPTKGYITVQAQFVSTSTLNTDMTAEISRDGGTTWTAVTLAAGITQGSFTLYEGAVDISSQPSGTSMKYRVKTLNSKTIYISGVVLRWS